MIPDYLVIGGIEIINNFRARENAVVNGCATVLNCDSCDPEVGEWLNMGQPYLGVVDDPAPWYDPAVPESANVQGIVGASITGLTTRQAATATRGTTTAANREFVIEFSVVLADRCAQDYIHGWLANMFGSDVCDDACLGRDVCMLACCPELDPVTHELIGPDPMRYMYGVETIEGPSLTLEQTRNGITELRYEVTLSTDNVYVWRKPPLDRSITVRPSDGENVTVDLPAAYEACPDDDECALPAECEPSGFAPLPSEPLPRCYPGEPFEAVRTVVTVPSNVMPSALDVIPVITATAGTRPLRNMVVRFFSNPLDIPCDRLPDLNPCRACTDLTVSEVPARSTLLMDGRTGLNTFTCPNRNGRDVTHPATVYGPPIEGAGAGYVDAIQCGVGLCIEIYAADGVAANAEIQIDFWTRTNGA